MSTSRERARCPFGWTANRCPGCDRRCSPQGRAEMATLFLRRFRFRSGAKDPERNTLRNAVINWPDGDEGEKSHFRDGSRAAVAGRLMAQPVYHQLGLPPASEIAGAFRYLRFVPTGESSTADRVIVACMSRLGRDYHRDEFSF